MMKNSCRPAASLWYFVRVESPLCYYTYLIGPGNYISTGIINFDQPFERTPFKPINNFKRTPDCKRASHMLQARA